MKLETDFQLSIPLILSPLCRPSAASAWTCFDFRSHFPALSLPSAHFLWVTAPFPVSVEHNQRDNTTATQNLLFLLVSLSISGPACRFPPPTASFSVLLSAFHSYLILKILNHLEVIKRWSDYLKMSFLLSLSLLSSPSWLFPTSWPKYCLQGGNKTHWCTLPEINGAKQWWKDSSLLLK